jgi:hypothetical protein
LLNKCASLSLTKVNKLSVRNESNASYPSNNIIKIVILKNKMIRALRIHVSPGEKAIPFHAVKLLQMIF